MQSRKKSLLGLNKCLRVEREIKYKSGENVSYVKKKLHFYSIIPLEHDFVCDRGHKRSHWIKDFNLPTKTWESCRRQSVSRPVKGIASDWPRQPAGQHQQWLPLGHPVALEIDPTTELWGLQSVSESYTLDGLHPIRLTGRTEDTRTDLHQRSTKAEQNRRDHYGTERNRQTKWNRGNQKI